MHKNRRTERWGKSATFYYVSDERWRLYDYAWWTQPRCVKILTWFATLLWRTRVIRISLYLHTRHMKRISLLVKIELDTCKQVCRQLSLNRWRSLVPYRMNTGACTRIYSCNIYSLFQLRRPRGILHRNGMQIVWIFRCGVGKCAISLCNNCV